MGKAIRNMSDELGMHFDVSWGRDKVGRWFTVSQREEETAENQRFEKVAE